MEPEQVHHRVVVLRRFSRATRARPLGRERL